MRAIAPSATKSVRLRRGPSSSRTFGCATNSAATRSPVALASSQIAGPAGPRAAKASAPTQAACAVHCTRRYTARAAAWRRSSRPASHPSARQAVASAATTSVPSRVTSRSVQPPSARAYVARNAAHSTPASSHARAPRYRRSGRCARQTRSKTARFANGLRGGRARTGRSVRKKNGVVPATKQPKAARKSRAYASSPLPGRMNPPAASGPAMPARAPAANSAANQRPRPCSGKTRESSTK